MNVRREREGKRKEEVGGGGRRGWSVGRIGRRELGEEGGRGKGREGQRKGGREGGKKKDLV